LIAARRGHKGTGQGRGRKRRGPTKKLKNTKEKRKFPFKVGVVKRPGTGESRTALGTSRYGKCHTAISL